MCVCRRRHSADPLMLAMTGGAGVITQNVGLMEAVSWMARQAMAVDLGHFPRCDGVEAVRLKRARSGQKRSAHPFAKIPVRGGVARPTAIAAGPGMFQLREDDAVVVRGHRPRRDKAPLPRTEEADEKHRQRGCRYPKAQAPALVAQRPAGLTRWDGTGAVAIGQRAIRARATVFFRARATPAALLFPAQFFKHRSALGRGAALAIRRGADATRAALTCAAALPTLIGPLIATPVEIGRWQLIFHVSALQRKSHRPARCAQWTTTSGCR